MTLPDTAKVLDEAWPIHELSAAKEAQDILAKLLFGQCTYIRAFIVFVQANELHCPIPSVRWHLVI